MLEIIFVSLVAGISILLAKKHKEIAWAIVIAFVIRISTTLINLNVIKLPEGINGGDAYAFEWQAWFWGNEGVIKASSHFFDKGLPWVYSNLGSLVYAIFGRSHLILSSISVLAGVYCVVLVWKLSMLVWGEHGVAKTSAWLVAIFPTLILYSSLTMREVFITLLFLYGMIQVILWVKTTKLLYALIALLAFSLQAFFHPGMATAGMLFIILVFLNYNKMFFNSLINNSSFDTRSFLSIMGCLIIGLGIYQYGTSLSFPYHSWIQIVKVDTLIWRTSIMASGAASYPAWLIAESPIQFLLLMVPKFFYFIFSPFPWDISKFKHLLGMLDGVCYMMLAIAIFSHRKYIISNPKALYLLIFIIFLILIFSIAVGNFGQGLRHRSKFLPIIIILASPYIYRLLFFKNKNQSKYRGVNDSNNII